MSSLTFIWMWFEFVFFVFSQVRHVGYIEQWGFIGIGRSFGRSNPTWCSPAIYIILHTKEQLPVRATTGYFKQTPDAHQLAIYMHNKAPSQSIIWTQPPEEEDKNISWLRLLSQKSVTSGKKLVLGCRNLERFHLDCLSGLNIHSLHKNQQI